MHNFKELQVWKKARIITKEIYLLTQKFPSGEKFGLTSQVQRATISISANIAEGSGRHTNKDFAKFLSYALASAYEVEAELILAYDLGYISKQEVKEIHEKLSEVQRMIYGLVRKFGEQ